MKAYIADIITKALAGFNVAELPEIQVGDPKHPEHGDASTNIALILAKPLKSNPRMLAQQIVDAIEYDSSRISTIEIAGPGFINFRYSSHFLYQQLEEILAKGDDFGKTSSRKNQRILVEFVSANPTGPLTVGHGRNAVLGDTVSRLLEWTGATVHREYYFNNAGRQMRMLGLSVQARYLEIAGRAAEFPEGGYEGEYIRDIAQKLADEQGDALVAESDESLFKAKAEAEIFADIRRTLSRMEIEMDSYFNEHSLYENGKIDEVIERLRAKDLVYEKDGATWFRTTQFGKETDTVLIKNTGEPTYRLPDIAYHTTKLDRGFDLCVDVFGADHIATYPDVLSGITALGYDASKVDVIVYQFVTIVKDGKPFKMSTRKANFVTLDELMDEVGADVTRFFFLMRAPNTHLEFDIAQAKEAGEKNPVFYLQYAYARICSILRKVNEEYNFTAKPDFNRLKQATEVQLIKTMLKFPEMIAAAADAREPHRVINYLNDLASDFTSFYHDCRILGEEESLAQARAELAKAVARVLKNGLSILGISAPERM